LQKRLSIVTPIYKDSALVSSFLAAFERQSFQHVSLREIIFIIDGSGIEDEIRLTEISRNNPLVKVLILSRNFGQHAALSAGYKEATGDYVCMMNVDQQDPINQIPKLLDPILSDQCDIVCGLRNNRVDGFFKNFSSKAFNYVLNKLTGDSTPLNVATMRIMNRNFLSAFNALTEKSRYIPGLESWLGFRKEYVEIDQKARKEGKSSYNFKSRIIMAFESIVSFSDLPLRIVTVFGLIVAFLGFILLFGLMISKLFFIDYKAGYTSTIGVIVFLSGVQITVIGMASVYIGRILKEVQNRPLYLIREKINFDV
jgi:glycosyltransferase involved in cell wall biosynthesis